MNTTKNYELLNLFPVPLGKFEIKNNFNDEQKKTILEYEQKRNRGNYSSVKRYVLEDDMFRPLKVELAENLHIFFKKIYAPRENLHLRITQSWLNFNYSENYHHPHYHPNSFISGVYYIQTTENDSIRFAKNHKDIFRINSTYVSEWNSTHKIFPVFENLLILFPSTLSHDVIATKPDSKVRISLSFNSFFVGTLGEYMNLDELIV